MFKDRGPEPRRPGRPSGPASTGPEREPKAKALQVSDFPVGLPSGRMNSTASLRCELPAVRDRERQAPACLFGSRPAGPHGHMASRHACHRFIYGPIPAPDGMGDRVGWQADKPAAGGFRALRLLTRYLCTMSAQKHGREHGRGGCDTGRARPD